MGPPAVEPYAGDGFSQGFGFASPLKPHDQLILMDEIAFLLNPLTCQYSMIQLRLTPETP